VRLRELGLRKVKFRYADGAFGWPEQGPFDAILAACAPSKVPEELLDQLADDGRLVLPVGGDEQWLTVIDRKANELQVQRLEAVRFVPFRRGVESVRTKWGLYWRGLAMEAVETIPGVSSGTLALITGIYAELIRTLGNLHPRLITTWRQQGLRAVWQQANLTFLLLLLAGMVTSIIPSVFIIRWFLANAAIPLWAFFCGLILMGTVVV